MSAQVISSKQKKKKKKLSALPLCEDGWPAKQDAVHEVH